MPQPIRRVVTGHDAQGRSIVIMDGPAPVVHASVAGVSVTEFWQTRDTPADNSADDDPTPGQPQRVPPPMHGSKFRVVEYPPDAQRLAAMQGAVHDAKQEGYVRDLKHARHPGFHKTDSIDYAIVLSGEIYALMDEGEVLAQGRRRADPARHQSRLEQPDR